MMHGRLAGRALMEERGMLHLVPLAPFLALTHMQMLIFFVYW